MGFENGTITKWNDEKGYGFIKPDSENSQIFVHITAFGRIVRRPMAGDRVYFDTIIEQEGERKAKTVRIIENVNMTVNNPQRTLQPKLKRQNYNYRSEKTNRIKIGKKLTGNFLLLVIFSIAIIGGIVNELKRPDKNLPNTDDILPTHTVEQTGPQFKCEGKRNCSQMSSPEEAKFYLENCPHDGMDGDGDGIPCEQQFKTHGKVHNEW
jgi:cold shock CspA family protein